MARWTLTIPEETDRVVRNYLAGDGRGLGDLSRLVDEAVRRLIFRQTVRDVKDRNAACDQQSLTDLIDEAVDRTRADRP